MSRYDIPVKCARCRHACMESDWIDVPSKWAAGWTQKTCPRCRCGSFYDMSPQVAWCWSTGLIEIGDSMPADSADGSGAIKIAQGPKYALKDLLEVVARHGYTKGQLLVPGVPEADTQREKGDALAEWLAWCGKRKNKDGVVFMQENAA